MVGSTTSADDFPRPDPGRLTRDQAGRFARLALKGVDLEYPNKLDHVMGTSGDVQGPRALHPAFYGSYDWHSSVHGHWMLARIARIYPDLDESKRAREVFARHFSAEAMRGELDYFNRAESRTFERPYGWAWLLRLSMELDAWVDPEAMEWARNVKPLADAVAGRYIQYFPKQTYPIRTGVHPNTAFGLALAHDYAQSSRHPALRELVQERARSYYAGDRNAPAEWEPSGNDFFSPTLLEADLMRRVMPDPAFRSWFKFYLPHAADKEPKTLFEPAVVTDRTDPQLVHLDGLNLNRAWTLRSIARAFPDGDPVRKALLESSDKHAEAGLAHVASGDYAGEHWLASFAVYLLTESDIR